MPYDEFDGTGDTLVDFNDDMLSQFPWHAPAKRPPNEGPKDFSTMRNVEGLIDDQASHPFRSPRVLPDSAEDTVNQDMSYAAARDHGISQGYHLFRAPPAPEVAPPPKTGWYVNASTLKSGHAPATFELPEEQQTKRKKHIKVRARPLISHGPLPPARAPPACPARSTRARRSNGRPPGCGRRSCGTTRLRSSRSRRRR